MLLQRVAKVAPYTAAVLIVVPLSLGYHVAFDVYVLGGGGERGRVRVRVSGWAACVCLSPPSPLSSHPISSPSETLSPPSSNFP